MAKIVGSGYCIICTRQVNAYEPRGAKFLAAMPHMRGGRVGGRCPGSGRAVNAPRRHTLHEKAAGRG